MQLELRLEKVIFEKSVKPGNEQEENDQRIGWVREGIGNWTVEEGCA